MKTDTTKATDERPKERFFLGTIGSIPWNRGADRIRGFIEELLEAELNAALGRDRYERPRLAETA